jgi:hypothetical protein
MRSRFTPLKAGFALPDAGFAAGSQKTSLSIPIILTSKGVFTLSQMRRVRTG